MKEKFLQPAQESGRALFQRNIAGKVVMLNLLKYKSIADYAASPEIAPQHAISGAEAYQMYMEATLPFLKTSGGEVLFYGKGGHFLIGPQDEYWDAVLLIRQNSVADFMNFANNKDYLKIMGHRTAAIEDSRLLPIIEDGFY